MRRVDEDKADRKLVVNRERLDGDCGGCAKGKRFTEARLHLHPQPQPISKKGSRILRKWRNNSSNFATSLMLCMILSNHMWAVTCLSSHM